MAHPTMLIMKGFLVSEIGFNNNNCIMTHDTMIHMKTVLYSIRCCFFRGWVLESGGLLQHQKTTVYI